MVIMVFEAHGGLGASNAVLAGTPDFERELVTQPEAGEFVAGGLASPRVRRPFGEFVFSSPEQLVSNTPDFYRSAMTRLNDELEGVYRYAEDHFGGKNLYLEEMDKNVNYAESVGSQRALHRLRRQPPASLPDGETGDDGTND